MGDGQSKISYDETFNEIIYPKNGKKFEFQRNNVYEEDINPARDVGITSSTNIKKFSLYNLKTKLNQNPQFIKYQKILSNKICQ